MGAGDPIDDRQPQSGSVGARTGCIAALERSQQPFDLIRRYPWS
jgi:hypothetical protein